MIALTSARLRPIVPKVSLTIDSDDDHLGLLLSSIAARIRDESKKSARFLPCLSFGRFQMPRDLGSQSQSSISESTQGRTERESDALIRIEHRSCARRRSFPSASATMPARQDARLQAAKRERERERYIYRQTDR